ncbi:hypothetical protein DICPUDRAFT_74920 [Dictyostelium purpureum]|uniref:Polymerase/histidinol phosphatase N-terminal domain-containing protein n=1 Tax=Dictyostelium purpureum TaxID=5786 RepID=F0Z947_DICPU|nr:uncharacterized protein DICPUDRAFT_74920 [Dictyostelium purpureum]EGC39515.1 hypothetical protein DICPUDRAFT_74920 [Dictyostelium purpureum]|eukprot:XP_003283962.1 hypothetical protein DICPUDRAFT_74920 [Dictyostelium purpureum]
MDKYLNNGFNFKTYKKRNVIIKYIKNHYYLNYFYKQIKFYFKNNQGKEVLTSIGIQLIFLAIVIGIIAPITIVIYNNEPRKYLDDSIVINNIDTLTFDPRNMTTFDTMLEKPNIFLNPHTHTTYSDGSLSPELAIQWHIANGYNVMFMTEHNRINGGLEGERIAKEKYSDKIIVIPGVEWTNCRCHLGLIGIRENVPSIKWPTNNEIKDLIEWVHSKGGFVILNHIPWSFWAELDQPSIEEWIEMGIDFLEVVNENVIDYQGIIYSKQHNLRYVTGIDLHLIQRADSWTVFNIPEAKQLQPTDLISSVAPTLTEELVMSTLKNKSTQLSFIFDAKGSIIKASKSKDSPITATYNFFSPFVYVGGFFHAFFQLERGMYSFVDGSCTDVKVVIYGKQIVALVFWILVFFALIKTAYKFFKQISYKILGIVKNQRKKDDYEKLLYDNNNSGSTSNNNESINNNVSSVNNINTNNINNNEIQMNSFTNYQ